VTVSCGCFLFSTPRHRGISRCSGKPQISCELLKSPPEFAGLDANPGDARSLAISKTLGHEEFSPRICPPLDLRGPLHERVMRQKIRRAAVDLAQQVVA